MAPIKSMLDQVEQEQLRKKIQFFFGAKTVKDLYYQEELRAWEKKLPSFKSQIVGLVNFKVG